MDYALLPFIFVLVISGIIGFIFSKSSQKASDYFLGSRTLGWGLLTMTFAASQIGGGFILGTAEAAFHEGPFALFFPLGYCLGFLGLGLGFGAKLRSLEFHTASDVFDHYYKSPFLKKVAALLSIISLTGILICQAIALRKFLFSMGWTTEWIFLFTWAIVIMYTSLGGFLAVVWTDTVQAVVMITMLIVTFFVTASHAPAALATTAIDTQWSHAQPNILGYLLMPCLFIFIEQDMVQRCFAAKSARDVSRAGLLAALILFALAMIPVYAGAMAANLGVSDAPTSKFMEVVKLLTNRGVVACAASAILLALISTSSSLLSAVSSNISQDFVDPAKKELVPIWKTKTITLATGLAALVGAYVATNILSCMVASYELSVACLFIPFVVAVFRKERAASFYPAAIGALFCGAVGFIVTKTYDLGTFGELAPLAASGIGFLGGMAFRKTEELVPVDS
jgi:SSS family solute:Na+ symporter